MLRSSEKGNKAVSQSFSSFQFNRSVVSNSVQPHRRQPTRLYHPWDSPGKNTGVGCHFLLQCVKVKSESEIAQLHPMLRDPVDCSLPGSFIHGIFPGKSTGVGRHCLLLCNGLLLSKRVKRHRWQQHGWSWRASG